MPRVLSGALLLAPVVFAGRMLTAWSRLPESMAVHFNAGGQPDSFVPPVVFLLVGVAALSWIAAVGIRRAADPFRQAIAAGITVVISVAFWQAVSFNLGEGQVAIVPAVAAGLVTALVVGALSWWSASPSSKRPMSSVTLGARTTLRSHPPPARRLET
jgi:multisubunit Na+/H+ antiporter MnhG subunit